MLGSENRADVPYCKRSLSGGANAADDWRAGGVSAFAPPAEPAVGDTAVGNLATSRQPNRNPLGLKRPEILAFGFLHADGGK
jgi:hypothetical protein